MMPDAAAVAAWLELLELPDMGAFVLLSSVLKQACRLFMSETNRSIFTKCASPVIFCTASSRSLHTTSRTDPDTSSLIW